MIIASEVIVSNMQSSSTDNFEQQVLDRLDRLSTDVEQLSTDVEQLKQELVLTNTRVDTYQKASTQVVNLAFGLIATATITIVITSVVR